MPYFSASVSWAWRAEQDRAAAEQVDLRLDLRLGKSAGAELVHSLEDAFLAARGHRFHLVIFVGDGEVIENALAVLIHAANAFLDENGDFIGEGWVVAEQIGDRRADDVRMSVLVLQAFAVEGGAAGGASHQEAAATHVAGSPRQIADPLKTEHRVINVERHHRLAKIGVRRPRRDE